MIIGIDIDDTINTLAEKLIKYAKIYNMEKNITHKIREEEWDFNKAYGWNTDNEREFFEKYIKNILDEAEVKKDASKYINKLKSEGNSIVIITARSVKNHYDIYNITTNWLNRNNICYDKIEIESLDKAEKCKKNNIDIFIDDNMYNCMSVHDEVKIPTFIFDSIYNKKEENTHIKRVFSWKQIYDEIHKLT